MRYSILLIGIVLSFHSHSYSQANNSLYCNVTQTQIGLKSVVYENRKDKTYKVYDEEYGMLNTFKLFRKIDEEWSKLDTITEKNPLSSFINQFDEQMDISLFENLSLKDAEGKAIEFVKDIDFIGDEAIDKIVLIEETIRNTKYFTAYVYENVNGDLIKCENCMLRFDDPPISFYLSKVEKLGMKTIIFICEGHLPGETLTMELLTANRISNPNK